MSAEARILDANANRAQEAARVLEDIARFALNDARLAGALKLVRHDIAQSLRRLPDGWLVAHRDAPGDVGAAMETASENARSTLADVAIAEGRRLAEALRVMEETGKLVDPAFARAMKSLRYRAYELDAAIQLRLGSGRARQWRLCLILTESLYRRPWREVLAAALDAGAECVQVREKQMDGGELINRVREVISLARPAGAAVIVNDRVDIALAAGADGVHLGQGDLAVADVRRLSGRRLMVGVSTHDMVEARSAADAGADYCGIGSMFASATQPGAAVAGPAFAREFIACMPNMPHLAIGGISASNVHEVVAAGVRGLAVSRAICAAPDPGSEARRLLEALSSAPQPQDAASMPLWPAAPPLTEAAR